MEYKPLRLSFQKIIYPPFSYAHTYAPCFTTRVLKKNKIKILHNDNKPKLRQTRHTKTPLSSIRAFFRVFIHGKEGSHFTDIFTYI